MLTIKSKALKALAGLAVVAFVMFGANLAHATSMTLPGTGVISKSSTKTVVMAAQQDLNETGLVSPLLVVDGLYGSKTTAAARVFQAAVGITVDGLIGPVTQAHLMAYGSTSMSLVPGCTSTTGYSSTTGASCATGSTTSLVPGCTGTTGYSVTTGASCATGTVTATGPLSASLSSDNPAAGTILLGQATADLAHFTFSGTGTLTSVTLQRSGLSDSSTFSNIYLYNGNVRLTDGYSFNTLGTLTMNGLNIPVNGSTVISVRGDVSSSATSSYSVTVALTGYTAAGASPTTTNIAGNLMYLAPGTLLGTATFGANTVGVTSSPAVNPGTTGYTVWSAPLSIGTHALQLKTANFRVIGSAPSDALANVTLYEDGVALSPKAVTTVINGSTYETFDFSAAPVSLSTGSHTLDLRADVVKGSARTVQLSLQQASDIMLYDPQIGVNVSVSSPTAGSFTANTTTYAISINQGSLTASLDSTFQGMTKVTGGSTNATIAKYALKAYGEDVKVNTLTILPVLTGCTPTCAGLENVSVYFNGSQIGSTTTAWTSGNITLTPGSQMIVPAGTTSSLEVHADLRTTGGVNYTLGTVSANLVAGTGTATGQSSQNSINIPALTGNTLAMQTGLLTVGSNSSYGSQTMNSNTGNVKIGSFVLQNQSTSEAVRVTSLRVKLAFALPTFTSGAVTGTNVADVVSSTTGFEAGDGFTIACTTTPAVGTVVTVDSATGIHLTYTTAGVGTCAGQTINDTSKVDTALAYVNALHTDEASGNGSQSITPTGTDTFSVDFTLAPGATKTINVMADLGAASFGTVQTSLAVQGLGATSNVVVYSNGASSLTDVTGQTITMATGSVANPTFVASNSTTAQYIASASGLTNGTTAYYKFTSSNGTGTVNEVKFGVTGPATQVSINGQTANVIGGVADVTGVNLSVPNGSAGVTVPVYVSYGPVGASGTGAIATSGTTSQLEITEIDYTIGGTSHTSTGLTVTAPTMMMVGAKPVLAATTTSNTGLTNNSDTHLMDVTVTPTGGDITLNVLKFTVTGSASSGTITLASPRLADSVTGTTISDFACTPSSATDITTGADFTCTASSGYLLSSTKTFSLYGTPAFSAIGAAGTSSVTTKLKQDAGATFSWTDTAGGATTAQTTNNGTYLYGYPTQTWSIHN
jgi:hypothetical protein